MGTWICEICDVDHAVVRLAVCRFCNGIICPHHYRSSGDDRAICTECIDIIIDNLR